MFKVINVTFLGEDVCDWTKEKSGKLEIDDLAKNLTTVKALQRNHKEIERELAPIKDKVGQVTQLGQDVIDSYPADRENIEQRTRDDQDEFGSLIQLGQNMYGRQPSKETEKTNSLGEERKVVLMGWQEKGDWLGQVWDLQLCNREADKRDVSTSVQVKLVEIQTVQQAQSFVKTHNKLEEVNNHSLVVDEVVEGGKKVLSGPRYASEVIANTANLTDAWNNILTAIETKGNQKLMLTAQQFFFEVAEVETWISDKKHSMKEAAFSKDVDSSFKLLDSINHVKLDLVVTQVNNSIYSGCHYKNIPFSLNRSAKRSSALSLPLTCLGLRILLWLQQCLQIQQ